MNTELDNLSTEVGEATTVMQSAATLIAGLSEAIKNAGTDKAKLKELTDTLDTQTNALAAEVAKNTVAEDESGEEGGEETPK